MESGIRIGRGDGLSRAIFFTRVCFPFLRRLWGHHVFRGNIDPLSCYGRMWSGIWIAHRARGRENVPESERQIFLRSRFEPGGLLCFAILFRAVAPFWRCGKEGGGWREERKHFRGERRCVPERCRAPQAGNTPLHNGAGQGHAAVVEQLLVAGAN